jgi:hypothetical protein
VSEQAIVPICGRCCLGCCGESRTTQQNEIRQAAVLSEKIVRTQVQFIYSQKTRVKQILQTLRTGYQTAIFHPSINSPISIIHSPNNSRRLRLLCIRRLRSTLHSLFSLHDLRRPSPPSLTRQIPPHATEIPRQALPPKADTHQLPSSSTSTR